MEQGLREALDNGIMAGYPVIDVRVELVDGSYHDVDSSEMAFKIAGSMAMKEGLKKAKSALLEPIMDVEVVTPAEYMGDLGAVDAIISEGCEAARDVAQDTMEEVRKVMGLSGRK